MTILFDDLLALRIANSSKPAYNIGTCRWLFFTNFYRYFTFSRQAQVIEHFCLWRFIGCNCKAQTIKQNLSHINDFFIRNNKPPVDWYKVSWKLNKFFILVNKILPPGKGSKPNSESLIKEVKKYFNFRDWSLYTSYCSFVLAHGLSMRESEYSETKDYKSPKLWQLTYFKDNLNSWTMQYIIPKSKKNTDYTTPEILHAKCVCPMLCVFHTMGEYLEKRLEINDQLSEKNKKYLFLFEKNLKIKFKDPKKYEYFLKKPLKNLKLQPYKATNASRVWNKVMVKHTGKKKHGHSLHGFRAAGVTDLIALGVSTPAVKTMTRHSNRSTAFQRYIRFTPENTANLIKSKKMEYIKFLKNLNN